MNVVQPPNLVFCCCLVIYVWVRHVYIGLTRAETKRVSRVDLVERLLLALMVPAVLILPLIYLFTPLLASADYALPAPVRWIGCAVLITSLWLFWRSHADLGRNWSVSLEIRVDHELVSSGVYRWLRHPMYASIWLWAMAQAMILNNWLAGWAVVPVFAAMYFIRIPREEQLMLEAFGDAYCQYAARTGRVLPRLRGSR